MREAEVWRAINLAPSLESHRWYAAPRVQGDNFLTDVKDITDKNCRVALTDFGMEPQKFLSCGHFHEHDQCGGVCDLCCGVL